MLPTYPTNLIPRPFANNGTFQVIPDAKTTEGRASWQEGFPVETQLPLSSGGIAPSRPDFNGILYMLSAMAFWQQSGGTALYRDTLNYSTPALVFSDSELWWCVAPNGPDVPSGVKVPGTDEAFWTTFQNYLFSSSGGGSILNFGVPVGTVIIFYSTNAPDGYFPCDGRVFSATTYPKLYALLGVTSVPDLRGYFVRGYDTRNTVDPDGAARQLGSAQQDAIRNITGDPGGQYTTGYGGYSQGPFNASQGSGAFRLTGNGTGCLMQGGNPNAFAKLTFDASLQVPTASENRPKNVTLLYCIKHD